MKLLDRTDIFKRFRNSWIVLADNDEVISWGVDLEKVVEEAKKKGVSDLIVTKIPSIEKDLIK